MRSLFKKNPREKTNRENANRENVLGTFLIGMVLIGAGFVSLILFRGRLIGAILATVFILSGGAIAGFGSFDKDYMKEEKKV